MQHELRDSKFFGDIPEWARYNKPLEHDWERNANLLNSLDPEKQKLLLDAARTADVIEIDDKEKKPFLLPGDETMPLKKRKCGETDMSVLSEMG